jgi:hypothetical protein
MVEWFYAVPYRFKTKDLKPDNPVLSQNIETVHYFDNAERDKVKKQAMLNDASLLQGSQESQVSAFYAA